MPRAIWSGAISFGLVNVPVKLYTAVQRKTVRFHQLSRDDQARVRQKRVSSVSGEEVAYEDIVKGYELSKDRYVVIEPEELEALDPQRSRTIDIEDFVALEEIDPVFFDHPYYLAPDTGAERPYRLLLDAMAQSGRVAIARVVLRQKESLVAIRAAGDALMMETMLFADEVVGPERIDGLPEASEAEAAGERELKMAQQLIDSLSGDWDPSKYRDEYREKVLELVERKAQGEEIAVQPEAEAAPRAPDLMAALEASLAEVRGRSEDNGGGSSKGSGGKGKGSSAKSGGGKGSSAKGSGSKAGSSKSKAASSS